MKSRIMLGMLGGLALAVGNVAAARDFNKLVEGEYMATGASGCLNGFNGFNATTLQPNLPAPGQPHAFFQSFDVQGVRTFNGDGTGSSSGTNISITAPNAFNILGNAGSSQFTGDFTYQVNPDLTIVINQGPLSGVNLTGGAAGQTFAVSGIPAFTGRVSEDLGTIILHHSVPGLETFTPSAGLVRQRVCYRERILKRVKRGG